MNVAQNPEVHKDDLTNAIALEKIFIEAHRLYAIEKGASEPMSEQDIDDLREMLPIFSQATENCGFSIVKIAEKS